MRTLLTFTTTTALALFAASAQAADKPSTINEWVEQASAAIEAKMEYPETAALVNETDTHTYVVTVNRKGDILDITKGEKESQAYFAQASGRALRYVDLPDLPASYKKDKLSFALVLDYTNQDIEEPKQTQVAKQELSDEQLIALSRGNDGKGSIDGF